MKSVLGDRCSDVPGTLQLMRHRSCEGFVFRDEMLISRCARRHRTPGVLRFRPCRSRTACLRSAHNGVGHGCYPRAEKIKTNRSSPRISVRARAYTIVGFENNNSSWKRYSTRFYYYANAVFPRAFTGAIRAVRARGRHTRYELTTSYEISIRNGARNTFFIPTNFRRTRAGERCLIFQRSCEETFSCPGSASTAVTIILTKLRNIYTYAYYYIYI